MGWEKFALRGDTYARALANAARRSNIPHAPEAFESIAKAPQATLDPHASAFARGRQAPGELPMTPERRQMMDLAHAMPWAGEDHSTLAQSETAVHQLNHQLRQRGLDQGSPANARATQARIDAAFGTGDDTYRQNYLQDRHEMATRPAANTAPLTQAGRRSVQSPAAYAATAAGTPALSAQPPNVAMPPARGRFPTVSPYAHTQAGATPPASPAAQGPPAAHTLSNHASPIRGNAIGAHAGTFVGRKVASTFETGLEKLAAALPIAAGVGIPLALGGGMLLRKPGIQSNLKNLADPTKGSTQEQDLNNELPAEALGQADTIHQALVAHGLDPATIRLGIDAPPGSGKTTLARALAQRTGMKHYGLDWEPGNAWKSTLGMGRNVEKMPHAPRAGEILEHYLLNRTHDPDLFDAQIHIKRDPNVIREQLRRRGNAAYIGDMMDLDKSLAVADLGFDTLAGDTIDVGNGVQLKLRPREGWGNNLDQALLAKGIDPNGLSRHEKLLSLHEGKRSSGAGWTPYVKNPFSTGETLALGASIPLGIMAAKALARRAAQGVPKVAGISDVWHDLSPLARRALIGGGVGATVGGLADSEHRGRGALAGGLLGAGAGVAYNHARPIKPAAMPGTYEATLYPRTRGVHTDYETVVLNGVKLHTPPRSDQHVSIKDFPDVDRPTHDAAGRPIQVYARPDVGFDAGHLSMREPLPADTWHILVQQAEDAYRPRRDVAGGEPFRASDWTKAPTRSLNLLYGGSLRHDSQQSAEINEMRRLLRKQQRPKTAEADDEIERMLKEAGILDALRRVGAGAKNQLQNLNMHIGNAMAHAEPTTLLNPTLPVPGVGPMISGAIDYVGNKFPQRIAPWVSKGIDAVRPSANPQSFGTSKILSGVVDHLAPGLSPVSSYVADGLVHGVPAALKRIAPSVAPHADTLLKSSV